MMVQCKWLPSRNENNNKKDFKDKIVRKSRISWPYKDHVSELAWYTNALGCYG